MAVATTDPESPASTQYLMEAICSPDNIEAALQSVVRNKGAPGIDGVTAETYEAHLEANLQDLLGRIRSGRYVAPPVRRAYIPKADGSQRPLGIPTHHA